MYFVKTQVSEVKHCEIRMQRVGSMLCQFSIVVHCIPRVYVIHTFGLAGSFLHVFTRKDRPRLKQIAHQGLRLKGGIMHTGSMFV